MEDSIYDKRGKPVAYITDDNEKTIYLWNGKAIAYMDNEHIYGFNGRHLGWFENDIIYDGKGMKIGFTDRICPSVTQVQPIKSIKHLKRVKSVRHVPPIKPVFSSGYSTQKLSEFLESGD
jgi:hypothetical protein